MTNFSKNSEEAFKQAFQNWDAPFSAEEMNAGWEQVKNAIPQAPASNPQGNAGSGGNAMLSNSMGKIAAWLGGTAAVITTGIILIYNINVNTPATTVENVNPSEIQNNEVITSNDSVNSQTKVDTTSVSPTKETPSGRHEDKIVNTPKIEKTPKKTNENTHQADAEKSPLLKLLTENNISSSNKNENNSNWKEYISLLTPVVCMGQAVQLNADKKIQNQLDDLYVAWGDGNSQMLSAKNIHTYNKEGKYKIVVQKDKERLEKIVEVKAMPEAHFNYSQNANLEVKFRSLSDGCKQLIWNFGDGSGWVVNMDKHRYSDTGKYQVTLVATNESGCNDTNRQWINVTNRVRPERQNIITPDGNGKNDELILEVENASYYHLIILNYPYGKTVFETNDPKNYWKGNMPDGKPAVSGTYFYLLQYRIQGEKQLQEETGVVTLNR